MTYFSMLVATGRHDLLFYVWLLGNNSRWMVPVSVSTASSPTKAVHRMVLDQQEATVTLNGVNPGDWVKVRPRSGHSFTQRPVHPSFGGVEPDVDG